MTYQERICFMAICFLVLDLNVGSEITCNTNARFRSFDGTCNNLNNPSLGASFTEEPRFRDANGNRLVDYADGQGLPRVSKSGQLPNPREVSRMVFASQLGPKNQFDESRSAELMGHGQLLAHDIIRTEVNEGFDCCDPAVTNDIDICFPIQIPPGDPAFPAGCSNFVRSTPSQTTGERNPVNLATSFVDASFLYGSTLDTSESLRVQDPIENRFLLKTDPIDILPTDPNDDSCFRAQPAIDRCPFAGDDRSAEAPFLGLNHLLWVRRHNFIASELHSLNPQWDSEKVFQEARMIVIAEVQHITFNDFLPEVIGQATVRKLGLSSRQRGFADPYDENVDPSTRNSFGAAPMRYGHTQVIPTIALLNSNFQYNDIRQLENELFSPSFWQRDQGKNVPDFARFMSSTSAMKIDNFIVDAARNSLFAITEPPGTDLAARNIQRAREQGVPDYNVWRQFCGLPRIESFSEFGKFSDEMSSLYSSVDDVDLFVGGLLEDEPTGTVGPTFRCLIGRQFQLYKTGDRFWYERKDGNIGFEKVEQLNTIKKNSSLARIFCHSGIGKIQKNIFRPGKRNNLVDCSKLPDIDLTLWKV